MNCITLFSRKNPHRIFKDGSYCWEAMIRILFGIFFILLLLILFIIPATVNASYNYVRYHDTHDMKTGCPLNSSIVCDDISNCTFDDSMEWKCNRLICHYDNPVLCIVASHFAAVIFIGVPVLTFLIIAAVYFSITYCQKMCGEVNLSMKYDEENPKQI